MRRQALLLILALSGMTSCSSSTKPALSSTKQALPDSFSTAPATGGVPFEDVVVLAAGMDETCVVVASGATYCAGGWLEGYNNDLSMARRVAGADHTTQLSIGESSCAVQKSGQVVCWGASRNPVLPKKGPGRKFDPVLIPELPPTSFVLANEAAYPYWGFARDDGSVWKWGGTIFDWSFVAPTQLAGLTLGEPVQVVSSHNLYCARSRAGNVTCWDQQGYVSEELVVSVKKQPAWLSRTVLDVAVSYPSLEHPQVACALDAEGRAACWHYTRGSPTTPRPFRHPFAGTHRWTDITMGPEHSCGVERDETVWCVGRNNELELGVQEPRSSSDTLLQVPGVVGAKAVAVGFDHSCALLKSGSVLCWGSNELGQCGAIDRHSRSTPTLFLRFVGDVAGS
jgi:hypothetical protein